MRRIFLVLVSFSLAVPASAQSIAEYLRMRKQHSVKAATPPERLNNLVGSSVMELRGTVKGSFRVNDRASLMVEWTSGKSQIVEAPAVPDWLMGNETAARMLIRVTRQPDTSLRTVLIGAAPEGEIARRELAAMPKPKPKPKPTPEAASPPNRSAALYGPIGRPPTPRKSTRAWRLPASQATPIYASYVRRVNPRLTNAEAYRIAQAVVGFSLRYGVDARLVMAILIVESGFDPNAVSHAGATGLGQLMPGTARGLGVRNPYDTTENLYGSIRLLRGHLETYRKQTGNPFDTLVLSLAAYNAGAGAVRRHGGVPPYRETQRYIQKVVGVYRRLSGQR